MTLGGPGLHATEVIVLEMEFLKGYTKWPKGGGFWALSSGLRGKSKEGRKKGSSGSRPRKIKSSFTYIEEGEPYVMEGPAHLIGLQAGHEIQSCSGKWLTAWLSIILH
ncbi:hypothetical protein FRB91_002013 [Serendipita sp. 411]|nr:hypothetical protein FRC19_005670 [Serendipita sp. 401]KAG8845169.1 hypothetical protein FRB91_002013 [Serendipita sp. 411]KAG9055936.1 hypothetical protein FS842_000757 [Serendipita sp. 407]